jgi:diguanylate cyclase (GGDEF)-like protein
MPAAVQINTNPKKASSDLVVRDSFLFLSKAIALFVFILGLAIVTISFVPSAATSEVKLESIVLGADVSEKIQTPFEVNKWTADNPNAKSSSKLVLGKVWVVVKVTDCISGCVVQFANLRSNSLNFWHLNESKAVALFSTVSADGVFVRLPPTKDSKLIGEIIKDTLYPITATQRPDVAPKERVRSSTKDRFGGLLFGALFALAAFSIVVSAINRDASFLILAGWLVTTCRIAAFNGPWDFYWLGIAISPNAQIGFLKTSLAFHGVLSFALFISMLGEHLKSKNTKLLNTFAVLLASMIPLSLFLNAEAYFHTFWIAAASSLLVTQFFAFKIAMQTKVLHAILFNFAWLTILGGVIAEILFASGYLPSKLSVVNVQTGAVAAALTMSIALADKMRRERNARLATQSSLVAIFKKFRALYGNVPIGLGTFDRQHCISENNEMLQRILGIKDGIAIKGKHFSELFPNSIAAFKNAFEGQSNTTFEFSMTVASKTVWLRVNFKNIGDTFDCTFEDITARKVSEQKLEFLARHDPLTGFKNRHEFDKTLQALLEDKTKLARTSVAHIDIKGFKLFNELFGHALGDEMLRQFATRIESANKRGHQVFRLDGDDFYVIFADMDGPTVEFECSIIQDALSRRHYVVNQRAMALEVGIGIVHLNDGISANDVLASASDASDRAKRSSETKVIAVSRDSEALKEQIQERHLMASMKQRFPEERLFLNAQPIISLSDPNSSLAYEVLVRLKGENGGVISPGQFIPAAEKNGLMSMVDRWVLNETLVWLELNKEHAKRVDFITVNLSGASLNDLRFAEDALAIIKEHRQLASKICFEVTESVALFDLKATLRFVEQTKSFGCKLALDDFGAGYTSFKYLKDIPSDILKIDGSYVRGINKSVANHAIVKAITDLTHEMGMKCVAEWIEDIPTIRTLQRLGMDYGQGFGMSRPMPMDDITAATSGFDAMSEPAAIEFYSKLLHLPHRRMQAASEQTDEAPSRILLPVA